MTATDTLLYIAVQLDHIASYIQVTSSNNSTYRYMQLLFYLKIINFKLLIVKLISTIITIIRWNYNTT